MWCDAVDERGFSIVVDYDNQSPPIFLLQHRSVDAEGNLPDTQGVPVTLIGRIAIKHCPSCGRNLSRWYRKNFMEFKKATPIESLSKE